jgi:hypothetical protein
MSETEVCAFSLVPACDRVAEAGEVLRHEHLRQQLAELLRP